MADRMGRTPHAPVERMMGGILPTPDRSEEPASHGLRDVCDHVTRMERPAFIRTDLGSGALEARLLLSPGRLKELVNVLMTPSAIWMLLPSRVCDDQTDFECTPNLKPGWSHPALRGWWNFVTAGMTCFFRRRWSG